VRVILHSDLNAFYANVECLYRPELKNVPLAVCGDPAKRQGIILAKNEPAKQMGVTTGEAVWQALSKCPELKLVPPRGRLYIRYSQLVRDIYKDYTPYIESYGIDECWLDVTGHKRDGVTIAEELRQRVKSEIGLTVSIGISFNKIFAKLGSDLKKPDAICEIRADNFQDLVWPLPVRSLLFVGRQTERKLAGMNVFTIGDLVRLGSDFLQLRLGKRGLTLWQSAMGLNQDPVSEVGTYPPVKSVGNSMTAIRNLHTDAEVKLVFTRLADEVAARLREQKLYCSTVQISLRDRDLFSWERQSKLTRPTQCSVKILQEAMSLYRKDNYHGRPLRSLGVRGTDLCRSECGQQLSYLPDIQREERWLKLERTVDSLRSRYGDESILRGVLLADRALAGLKSYSQVDLPECTLPGSVGASYLKPGKIYKEVV